MHSFVTNSNELKITILNKSKRSEYEFTLFYYYCSMQPKE